MNIKYFFNFTGRNKKAYRVEILEDAVVTSTEVKGVDGFKVDLSALDNKFQSVRGTGCSFSMLSETDRQFINLYTADVQQYQIRLYEDDKLIWCGYLDSEIYSEDFSKNANYSVDFSGSDGFAILERLLYVDDSDNAYSGVLTQWEVLKNIIQKLNLPYKNLYVGLSTEIAGNTPATDETIFHQTYTIQSNYIDEDGESFTCRKVLEGILKPYAAYIMQDNGNLFILDHNIALEGTETFKVYNSSTFTYTGTEVIDTYIGDLENIGWKEPSQTVNIVSAFNKQIITYSPYVMEALIDDSVSKEDFTDEDGNTNIVSNTTYGDSTEEWIETVYSDSLYWTPSTDGKICSYVGLDEYSDKEDSYLHIDYNETPYTKSFTYKSNKMILVPSDYFLKIEFQAMIRFSDDIFVTDSLADVKFIKLHLRPIVGDYHYYYYYSYPVASGWTTNNTTNLEVTLSSLNSSLEYEIIDMKWINSTKKSITSHNQVKEVDLLIPLDFPEAGEFSFEILNFEAFTDSVSDVHKITSTNYSSAFANMRGLQLKDIKLTVTNSEGVEIDQDDKEYIGYMNARFKDEGDEVELIQGTSLTKSSIERASLISYDGTTYNFIDSWTRATNTDIIENLLLGSIMSNYETKSTSLLGILNKLDNNIGYLTYTNWLSDKFMLNAFTTNYYDSTSEIELISLEADKTDIWEN